MPRRTSVIIDYENVYRSGLDLFGKGGIPRDNSLIEPLSYALSLIRHHNSLVSRAEELELLRVIVHRGIPAQSRNPAEHSKRIRQQELWQRDRRVEVHYRDLKYRTDGTSMEKGIDVCCALSLVEESRNPDTQVVVLASGDSDILPALELVENQWSAEPMLSLWERPGDDTEPAYTTIYLGEREYNQSLDSLRHYYHKVPTQEEYRKSKILSDISKSRGKAPTLRSDGFSGTSLAEIKARIEESGQ